MPHLGPIKRRDLIYYLRQLGFEGPYPGGNHQYMVKRKENIILTFQILIKGILWKVYWPGY